MRLPLLNRALPPAILLFVACPVFADIWYVHVANQRGAQDGKSWATAFTTIQPAIDAAHAAGGGEVWIAAGTYAEPRSYMEDGIETGALVLRDGISLCGSFTGNETRRAIRDFEKNPTVITGKLSRAGEKSLHFLIGSGTVRLDGLVIRDGFAGGTNAAQSFGGGLRFEKGNLTIENCNFADNVASRAGAGVSVHNAAVVVRKSRFSNNSVRTPRGESHDQRNGGGLLMGQCSEATVQSCNFIANACPGYGGGLYANDTPAVVTGCSFEQNHTDHFGGGAYFGGAAATLEDCTFTENSSVRFAGAARFGFKAAGHVTNCRFERNTAGRIGGAVTFFDSAPSDMTGCVFVANRAEERFGAAVSVEGASVTLRNSTFEDNFAPCGAAVGIADAQAYVENCTLRNNTYDTFGQVASAGTLTVTNSRIDASRGKLFSMMPTKEFYFTLADVQRRFPAWTNNFDLTSPAPVPAASFPAPPPPRLANEQDSISIKSGEAEITVSGSNTVLYTVAAAVTVVFLVLAFGWFYLSQRRTGNTA